MKRKYEVRKLDSDEPLIVVESDDPVYAPDEAGRHVRWHEPGNTIFFECRLVGSDDPWDLWLVECVSPGAPLILFTVRTTYEEARKEIAENRPS